MKRTWENKKPAEASTSFIISEKTKRLSRFGDFLLLLGNNSILLFSCRNHEGVFKG